jgi:hypothetical protein
MGYKEMRHNSDARPKPVRATQVSKSQILSELTRSIEGIRWSYGGARGVVTDPEMLHSIACQSAAIRVIDAIPASRFPLGGKRFQLNANKNPLISDHRSQITNLVDLSRQRSNHE